MAKLLPDTIYEIDRNNALLPETRWNWSLPADDSSNLLGAMSSDQVQPNDVADGVQGESSLKLVDG
jgi:hypothetical protein